jgi:mRNA interferase RelE/StbE
MKKNYKIVFNKRYLKDLEKIPRHAQKHIREKMAELAFNPRPEGCKKLQGSKDEPLYRIRSGDYRIIYSIQDDVLLVLIIEVGHRRNIYQHI